MRAHAATARPAGKRYIPASYGGLGTLVDVVVLENKLGAELDQWCLLEPAG